MKMYYATEVRAQFLASSCLRNTLKKFPQSASPHKGKKYNI